MPANGTDQSGLYDLRGGADTDYRDRSMEQSNTTNGNPQGYIPPLFNGSGLPTNNQQSYYVPQPSNLILPTGPGQMLSMPMNSFAAGQGNSPLGGNKYGSPLVLPGLQPLPGPPPVPTNSQMTNPTGSSGSQPAPGTAPPAQLALPQFPANGLGYVPLSGGTPQPPNTSLAPSNYNTPGSADILPDTYQSQQPQPVTADPMGNSVASQTARHNKAMGFMPTFTPSARARAGGKGSAGSAGKAR